MPGEERESEDLCDEPGQDDEASLGNAAGGPKHMADLEHLTDGAIWFICALGT